MHNNEYNAHAQEKDSPGRGRSSTRTPAVVALRELAKTWMPDQNTCPIVSSVHRSRTLRERAGTFTAKWR